jgi:hypothetical protein
VRDNVDRHWDQVEYMFQCEHLEEEPVRGLVGWARRKRGERAFRCTDCGLETRVVKIHRMQ